MWIRCCCFEFRCFLIFKIFINVVTINVVTIIVVTINVVTINLVTINVVTINVFTINVVNVEKYRLISRKKKLKYNNFNLILYLLNKNKALQTSPNLKIDFFF
jgi:hypothetical protein